MSYISFEDYKKDIANRKAQEEVVKQNQKTQAERGRAEYEKYKSQPQQPLQYVQQPQNDVYIPAQFGQRIVDRQRQQEYASRLSDTYIPATLAQDAINRSGQGNDFNAFADRALRYDYLSKLDTNAARSELESLGAEPSKEEQRQYNRAKAQYASYGNNTDNNEARAIKRYIDEYEANSKKAEQLRKNLQDAETLRRLQWYEAARNNDDFAEMSQATGSKRVAFNLLDPTTWAADDEQYYFINNIDGYRDNYAVGLELDNAKLLGVDRNLSPHAAVSKMSDKEIAMYNYLYNTQGREAAERYLDDIMDSLNYRVAQEEAAAVGDNALKAMSYGFQSGIDQFGRGVSNWFQDEATPVSTMEYGSAMVRENMADSGAKLPEFLGGNSLGQVAYDLSYTAGNMAPSVLLGALTGGAGAATMGVSAGGNATMEAMRQGYSKEQATKYGLLVGASEGALQYLLGGISKLGGKFTGNVASKAIQNIDSALLRVAANSGIKMAGEGTEEYLQEILEPIYRNLIFNENNQIDLADPDAVYSFMLGALTSGVMETPANIRSTANAAVTDIQRLATRTQNSPAQSIDQNMVNTPSAQIQTADTGVATAQEAVQSVQPQTNVQQTIAQPQANTSIATAQETNTQVNAQRNPKTEQTDVRGERAGIQPDANAAPLIPDTNRMEADRDGREIAQEIQQEQAVNPNPQTVVEKIRKLKRDVSNYTYSPERVYTAEDYEALSNKRIEDYTPDDVFAIVSELQNKRGLHNKDISRVLNSVSGDNLNLRNALYNLIEKDFNAASGNQGRMQTRDLAELRDRYIAAGVDLKNKNELSAIMKYGEKGYIDSDGSWVEYGLEDLKREFPEKWEKLSEVAEQDRALYDSYLDRINEMRERIYPEMMKRAQQELESARESVALYTDKISRIEQTISSIENDIASKRNQTNSKKRTDTLSFEKLQSSIDYGTKRLNALKREYENAQQKLEDAKFRAARLEEEIRNGEPLHQRKIEPRRNYYHHVGAFDPGILSLIGSKTIIGETVAGKVSDGDAATVAARTIDRLIDSILGKNEIAPGMVGVSDNTRPRARFQGIMEHRKGGAYKLNSFESMAEYIGIADYMLAFDEYTSNIRDITDILRSAADKIDKTGDTSRNANSFIKWLDDWNNMLTGKTNPIDRGVQNIVGRNVMNGIKKLNSLVRSSTLLSNFRSALIQPSAVANAMHYIPNPVDWVRGGRYIANAMSGKTDYGDVVSMSNFLSQRDMLTPNDILNNNASRKVKNAQAKMLSIGQNAADKLIWWTAFAKYDEASQTPGGLEKLNASYARTYENAVDFADDITRKSVAGRGVGEQPITIKSTVVDALAPFQTEVLNQYNAFVESLQTLLGKGSTKNEVARAAAGLVSYEISAFAINSLFKAIFGDSVLGFDFIGALFAALTGGDDEDEENATLKRLGKETTAAIMSGLPFASAYTPLLMDTETAKSIFGEDGNPSRYGTGMMGTSAVADLAKTLFFDENATGWDAANALAAFFPYGGKQIVRTAQGLDTYFKGGSYKTNKSGEKQLQYEVDQNLVNLIKMGLFGKWSTSAAQDYIDSGFKMYSVKHTQAYTNAKENGVDGSHALMLIDEYKALKPEKNEQGETTKSTSEQFREILFNDKDLTPEQKAMFDRDVIGASNTADYSDSYSFKASQLSGKGYERYNAYVEAGIKKADALEIAEWKRSNSGKEKTIEYLKKYNLTQRQIDAVLDAN